MLNFKKIKLIFVTALLCGSAFAQVSQLDDKTFVVRANKDNTKLIDILIKELDNPKPIMNVKVIPLQYAYSLDLQPLLQNIMFSLKPNKLNTSELAINRSRWDSNQHGMVLADSNTNQVIIISDDKSISQIEKLIKALDTKTELESNELLIKLKNAKADSLANILNSIGGNNVSRR